MQVPLDAFLARVARDAGVKLLHDEPIPAIAVTCTWPGPVGVSEAVRVVDAVLAVHARSAALVDGPVPALVVRRVTPEGGGTSPAIAGTGRAAAVDAGREEMLETRIFPLLASDAIDAARAVASMLGSESSVAACVDPACIAVAAQPRALARVAATIDAIDRVGAGPRIESLRLRAREPVQALDMLAALVGTWPDPSVAMVGDDGSGVVVLRGPAPRVAALAACLELLDTVGPIREERSTPLDPGAGTVLASLPLGGLSAADARRLIDGLLVRRVRSDLRMVGDDATQGLVIAGGASEVAHVRTLLAAAAAPGDGWHVRRLELEPTEAAAAVERAKAVFGSASATLIEFDAAVGELTLAGPAADVARFARLLAGSSDAARRSGLVRRAAVLLRGSEPRALDDSLRCEVVPLASAGLQIVTGTPDALSQRIAARELLRPAARDETPPAAQERCAAGVAAGGASPGPGAATNMQANGEAGPPRAGVASERRAPPTELVPGALGEPLVAGRGDAVAAELARIAAMRGLGPDAWLARLVEVPPEERAAMQVLAQIAGRSLAVVPAASVAQPSVRSFDEGSRAWLQGAPAQVRLLEAIARELRPVAPDEGESAAGRTPADGLPLALLCARIERAAEIAVELERESSARAPEARRARPLWVASDPESDMLALAGHVEDLAAIRAQLGLAAGAWSVASHPMEPSVAGMAADALRRLAPEEHPPVDRFGDALVHVRRAPTLLAVADQRAQVLHVDRPDADGKAVSSVVEVLASALQPASAGTADPKPVPQFPGAIECFRVVRGDIERLAQSLRDLAARGLLGAASEPDARSDAVTAPAVVKIDAEKRVIVVSGQAVQVAKAAQFLRQSDALVREKRQAVVDAFVLDPEELRVRALATWPDAAEPDRPALEASADPTQGTVVVRGTAEEVERFRAACADILGASAPPSHAQFMPLGSARAAELAAVLDALGETPRPKRRNASDPRAGVVALEESNALLLAGSSLQVEALRLLARHLDADARDLVPLDVAVLPTAMPQAIADAIEVREAMRDPGERRSRAVSARALREHGAVLVAASPGCLDEVRRAVTHAGADASTRPSPASQSDVPRVWRVMPLRSASAASVARMLTLGFSGLGVAADLRTNALVMTAPASDIGAWSALVEALDRPAGLAPLESLGWGAPAAAARTDAGAALEGPMRDRARDRVAESMSEEIASGAVLDPFAGSAICAAPGTVERAATKLPAIAAGTLAELPPAARSIRVEFPVLRDPAVVARLARGMLASTGGVEVAVDAASGAVIASGSRAQTAAVAAIGRACEAHAAAPDRATIMRIVPLTTLEPEAAERAARDAVSAKLPSESVRVERIARDARRGSGGAAILTGSPVAVDLSTEAILRLDTRVPGATAAAEALPGASGTALGATADAALPAVDLLFLPVLHAEPSALAELAGTLLRERGIWPQALLDRERTAAPPVEPLALSVRCVQRDSAVPSPETMALIAPPELGLLARHAVRLLDAPTLQPGDVLEMRVYPVLGRDPAGIAAAVAAETASRHEGARVMLTAFPEAGAVMAEDAPARLDRAESVLASIDPRFARDAVRLRTMVLRDARAVRVAPLVASLLGTPSAASSGPAPGGAAGRPAGGDGIRVRADSLRNAVTVMATPSTLDMAEALVRQFDVGAGTSPGEILRVFDTASGDAPAMARFLIDFFETDDAEGSLPDIRPNAAGDALLVRANPRRFEAIQSLLARRDAGVLGVRELRRVPVDPALGDALAMAGHLRRFATPIVAVESTTIEEILRNTEAPASARDAIPLSAPTSSTAPLPSRAAGAGALLGQVAERDALVAGPRPGRAASVGLDIAIDEISNAVYLFGAPREIARAELLLMQSTRAMPPGASMRMIRLPASCDPEQLAERLTATVEQGDPAGGDGLSARLLVAAHPDERALLVLSNGDDFATVAPIAAALSRAPRDAPTEIRQFALPAPTLARAASAVVASLGEDPAAARLRSMVSEAGDSAAIESGPVVFARGGADEDAVLVGAPTAVERISRFIGALSGNAETCTDAESGTGVRSVAVLPLRNASPSLVAEAIASSLDVPARDAWRSRARAPESAGALIVAGATPDERALVAALDLPEARTATAARIVRLTHRSASEACAAAGVAGAIAVAFEPLRAVILVGDTGAVDEAGRRLAAFDADLAQSLDRDREQPDLEESAPPDRPTPGDPAVPIAPGRENPMSSPTSGPRAR